MDARKQFEADLAASNLSPEIKTAAIEAWNAWAAADKVSLSDEERQEIVWKAWEYWFMTDEANA